MDSDGRLGCEEFVLAMHLCDIAKAGEVIPPTLPPELIPPTFKRQRQSSISSQGVPENVDPLAGMPQVRFIILILSTGIKTIKTVLIFLLRFIL